MDKNLLTRAADNIRVLAASMVEKAKSGHPGGAMGGADFVNVLYSSFLVTDPDNPTWIARDRFFLDPGHMSSMLYAVLALTGKYTMEELKEFRQWGSVTPGHPEVHPERGVENTSGPLGQGHVMAVGCAIAERFLQARFAGYLGLNNLIMFYDSNDIQLSTEVKAVTTEDTAAKYRAWHWNVIEVDGTDPIAMAGALETAIEEKNRPTLIIGKTVMGRGAVTADGANFEGKCSTHGNPLSKSGASYDKTIENLGADPKDPFHVWEDVKKLYAERAEALRKEVAVRHEAEKAWREANPDQAAILDGYLAGKLPDIDWKNIAHKPNIATRQASADVLAELAKKVGNMIVSSADLANSDKTDAFLKNTTPLTHGDFTGAFLHAGVAELTMAALMNGIALHGGLIAACGTFFATARANLRCLCSVRATQPKLPYAGRWQWRTPRLLPRSSSAVRTYPTFPPLQATATRKLSAQKRVATSLRTWPIRL